MDDKMKITELMEELMCLINKNIGSSTQPSQDPEAWREEYRKKQEAGVKFECFCCDGEWEGAESNGGPFNFTIPAQPIPEKLLEVPQEVFASECQKAALEHLAKTYSADKGAAQLNPPPLHAAERALWKAQREAGTNEIWQKRPKIGGIDWADIRHDLMFEPGWDPDWDYHVKPMKLTAKICRKEILYKTVQDWQFTGTREEYRAECEKYGYSVVSEIKEVVEKPKTVKYYFALYKTPDGCIGAEFHEDKQRLTDWIITCCGTIIGDIEEREIKA